MTDAWYISASGRLEGPLTLNQLRERVADGRLRSSDSVSSDRRTWIPARQVAGLTFPPSTVVYPEPIPQAPKPLTDTVVSGRVGDDTAPPPDRDKFSPLDSVPGYQVIAPLGTGACGVVFKAMQLNLNRVVALKTVRMAENMPADIVARFEQEAVALARLQHPNIVAVYDCGHTHGRAFFAMELLEGEDLAQRLNRTGPLDERTAWLIARQTAAALAHAATLGVIHRDVKPANLFLVNPPTGFPLPEGVPMVKVTDFGLALARRNPGDSDHRQTAAGVVLGTPVYMAPEQFSGSSVDPRADMYSLGATMHHVLTGQPPFDGKTVWEVMMKKSLPCPRLESPISKETADLVEAMLSTNVADRPADYTQLIARIDALPCLAGAFSYGGLPAVTPTQAPAPTRPALLHPARRRKRWVYALAALAVLGVAVAVTGALKLRAKQPVYTSGAQEALFDRQTVRGWNGPGWAVEPDAEKTQVLVGNGTVIRTLRPLPNFRVILSLDLHQATAAEVVVATSERSQHSMTQWVVHLDHKEVVFGKRVGDTFEPVGQALRVPTAQELAAVNRLPYLEVQYERAGGWLSVWFRGQSLGGIPADGLRMAELRVNVAGGPIRIESADLVEMVEQK